MHSINIFVELLLDQIDPHLMYKVEKWLKGEHQCENCGFDPVKAYPTLYTKAQSSIVGC